MSKFTTNLPTNIEELVSSLPKGSYVHGITLNPQTKEIVVLWENTKYESGLTVPVEFKIAEIKGHKTPKSIKEIESRKAQPATVVEEQPKKEESIAVPVVKYLGLGELDDAIANGDAVEYMGIEHVWNIFNSNIHSYTPGYFYRKVDKVVVSE